MKKGETGYSVAKKLLGNGKSWTYLVNQKTKKIIASPNSLKAGMVVYALPVSASAKKMFK